MKKILLFVLALALGLIASAWFGLEDGRSSAARRSPRDQLNAAASVSADGGEIGAKEGVSGGRQHARTRLSEGISSPMP